MLDKSTLPYEENVKAVREAVRAAHAVGVTVEAELGHVGKGAEYEETRDSGLTRKEEAAGFVKETGVDCLAVAVGTSHGVYRGKPLLNFELLSELSREVSVPLVLHGCLIRRGKAEEGYHPWNTEDQFIYGSFHGILNRGAEV